MLLLMEGKTPSARKKIFMKCFPSQLQIKIFCQNTYFKAGLQFRLLFCITDSVIVFLLSQTGVEALSKTSRMPDICQKVLSNKTALLSILSWVFSVKTTTTNPTIFSTTETPENLRALLLDIICWHFQNFKRFDWVT